MSSNQPSVPRHAYSPLDIANTEFADEEFGITLQQKHTQRRLLWEKIKATSSFCVAGIVLSTLLVLAVTTTPRRSNLPDEFVGASGKSLLHNVVNPIPQLEVDFRGKPRQLASKHGVVAADNSRCSDVGASVLKEGGNAIDSAVATVLCLGVVSPQSSGIGGGAFITIYRANGTAEVINAREPAPAAANSTMYSGMDQGASVNGGLAIAVPMELKGLYVAWQRHGVLPWERLVLPAALLAERGYTAHPYFTFAASGPQTLRMLRGSKALREAFLIPDKSAEGGWRVPEIGEWCCRRPLLAQTLRRVAREGPGWMFEGAAAETLAKEIQDAGGIITAADLSTTAPRVEKPLWTNIGGGFQMVSPLPPSSAVAAITAMKILAGFKKNGSANAENLHYVVESMKHAFALRMSLGDPGSSNHPEWDIWPVLHDMLDDKFADTLREVISPDHTLNITQYGGKWHPDLGNALDDHGTSHMCVVDGLLNAVSITSSVNTGFGSGVVSESTGIILNNQMDDFSRPDRPNIYGLHPTEANFIQPGKRPLSSMSPSIVVKDKQVVLAAGASGGPLIITATYQAILRVLLQEKTAWQAVTEPRLHHQLLPDKLIYENFSHFGNFTIALDEQQQEFLKSKGHTLYPSPFLGVTQVITVGPSQLITGVSDPRKDGAPAAFDV